MSLFKNKLRAIAMSTFCIVAAGCGSKHLTELRSADGSIEIRVVDPVRCDESRSALAQFTGHGAEAWLNSEDNRSKALDSVRCGYAFDPSDYLLIEANGWLVIASKLAIASQTLEPTECVYVFIDRRRRELCTWTSIFDVKSPAWPEVLEEIQRRRTVEIHSPK